MGQDVVARDEVELHSSCVILEGQEALPHDGILLLTGKQTESELTAGKQSHAGHSPREQLASLSQVGLSGQ